MSMLEGARPEILQQRSKRSSTKVGISAKNIKDLRFLIGK